MYQLKSNLLIFLFLSACTQTIISYPSVCPNNELSCQRNLNAQTLSLLGEEEAALQIMCMDPELSIVLHDECAGQ